MLEFQYMDPSFDIQNVPYFNNIDGLKDISYYLDFALSQTIHKQLPNITIEVEKYYAKDIFKRYMTGDEIAFTSQHNIRNNISIIGREKLKALLLKTMIEKDIYNKRVMNMLSSQNYLDQCATYITNIAYNGQLDQNNDWIKSNLPNFIDIYIEESYGKSHEMKDKMEQLCYENTLSTKALEQLNLEMSLNRIKN